LLYPIQPQLQFAFFMGIESLILGLVSLPARIAGSRESRWTMLRKPGTLARRLTLAVLLILLLTSIYESLEFSDSRGHIGDLTARTLYIQKATPPSAVLLTEAPVVDYLYGGRKTVPYPVTYPSVKRFERYLKERQVDTILVAPRVGWQLNYKPEYTARAKKTLEYLNELVEQGKLSLIYNSEADLIKVYQVR
jgi:hypothetical protein